MSALPRVASVAAIAAALAVSSCATPELDPHSLAETSWVLVSIQSMSDDQGTVRPNDPARYSLSFGADGRATLRLDCNRALGAYKATPSLEGTSGELSFEPLAATRAMCPPGSLEPRLVKALAHVRSYLMKDGRLHLSLVADGGVLTWISAR